MAEVLGVSQQAVYFWRAGKRGLPAEHCPTIEKLIDGAITCEQMRPDVDWAYLRGTAPAEPAASPDAAAAA